MSAGMTGALNFLTDALGSQYKETQAAGARAKAADEQRKLEFFNSDEYSNELKDSSGNVIARRDPSEMLEAKKQATLDGFKSTTRKNKEDQDTYDRGLVRIAKYETDPKGKASGISLEDWDRRNTGMVDIDAAVEQQKKLAPGRLAEYEAEQKIGAKYDKTPGGGGGKFKPLVGMSPTLKAFAVSLMSLPKGGSLPGKAVGNKATQELIKAYYPGGGVGARDIASAAMAGDPTATSLMYKIQKYAGEKEDDSGWGAGIADEVE